MASFVFNNAKGKTGYYATLPAANDAIWAILLKSAGLEADGTLKDYTTLATLLAAANDEADFTNYSRKTLTTVTVAVDNTNDWLTADCDDLAWSSAGGATNNTLGKCLFCYVPDTTAQADSTTIPLTAYDCAVTTNGSTLTGTINAAGWYKAA